MPEENNIMENEQPVDESISKDFLIEKNVLKKYIGTDSHVLVPDTITAIGDGALDRKSTRLNSSHP